MLGRELFQALGTVAPQTMAYFITLQKDTLSIICSSETASLHSWELSAEAPCMREKICLYRFQIRNERSPDIAIHFTRVQ